MTTAKPNRPLWTRRRALTVLAGAAAASAGMARTGAAEPFRWRGTALGADADIALYHRSRSAAQEAIDACLREIERLENEFSLYRPQSALCRLNRDGVLHAPSHDMRKLLSAALRFGRWSRGAFDITMQPLWQVYAEHFTRFPLDEAGPPDDAIQEALLRIDFRRIHVAPSRIEIEPGTKITLNGIAQGYITDRIADLLRGRGWSNVLINLGEFRALDTKIDGKPWQIGVRLPRNGGRPALTVPLSDRSLATSGGYGTPFGRSKCHHHLIDPRTGRSANQYHSVSVMTSEAMKADALSTALYIANGVESQALLKQSAPAKIWFVTPDEKVKIVES